jgi:hypothetical protein
MEKLSINSEKYKRGLEYEVFCECVTIEMAWHGARLDKSGDDSEEGRLHFAAMKSLKELRDSVDLHDENSIKRAWLVLKAMKADRKEVANQPMPIDNLLPKAKGHGRVHTDLQELRKTVSCCGI